MTDCPIKKELTVWNDVCQILSIKKVPTFDRKDFLKFKVVV